MANSKVYVAGIDIGSSTSKAVILDADGLIVSSKIIKTTNSAKESAGSVLKICLEQCQMDFSDISYIVATGYGRAYISIARKAVSEILCHSKGIFKLFPSARTIIDLGGQDAKIILLDNCGEIKQFTMNDKCAAGTGRFLEVMSSILEMSLDEMGTQAAMATERPRISNICTVFAESEVIGLIMQGLSKDKIAAGLCQAISSRLYDMMSGLTTEKDFVITGGGAKNAAIVKMLGERIGVELLVPKDPQITGALGAALIGLELLNKLH